ncbi:hypothetical protein SEEM038_14839, partial [Salmonella enterica subsp. enterica serovar Senftenberg str. NC_MB012510-0038]
YELNIAHANEIQFHFDILYADLYNKNSKKIK